jgi:hypothetical protein
MLLPIHDHHLCDTLSVRQAQDVGNAVPLLRLQFAAHFNRGIQSQKTTGGSVAPGSPNASVTVIAEQGKEKPPDATS